MKEQILAIYNKAKSLVIGNPFISGLVIGYIGSPVIKIALDAIGSIIKETLKLI